MQHMCFSLPFDLFHYPASPRRKHSSNTRKHAEVTANKPSSNSISFPELSYPAPRSLQTHTDPSDDTEDVHADEDDLAHIALAEHLNQLALETVEDKFFGQSRYFF
jgi:hypothetical protein